MELWRLVLPEVRRNFLNAVSPPNILTQEQNLSREIASFAFDVRKSDYLYPMAEAFRYALLTQVEGFAITSLKFRYQAKDTHLADMISGVDFGFRLAVNKAPRKIMRGLTHKYGYLDGVVESVRDIVTNFQQVIFSLAREIKEEEIEYKIEGKDPKKLPVRSEHFSVSELVALEEGKSGITFFNRDHILFHFEQKPFRLHVTVRYERGRGFRRAEETALEEISRLDKGRDVLLLPIDADFNPIKRVGFSFDQKYGQNVLRLTIQSKGNVTPMDAYKQAYQYLLKKKGT